MPAKRIVLAEYFTTSNLTLLFIVREDFDKPEIVQINTPLADIRSFVSEVFGTAADIRNMSEAATKEWHAMFGPFVEPILAWSEEDDIIWFVPHDILHYVPLHAVRVDGRYLAERNAVCYAPSASVMKHCQGKRNGRGQHALVVGDSRHDLAHAREEAYAVADLFGQEPLIGKDATKTRVMSLLEGNSEQFDILHFACHGRLDREQALKSGILLAQESPSEDSASEDFGILTAEEIFDLQLNADLVTLSACDSGVNDRRPGDELIGLTRALIYAGTPSVLVSLWSVDDLSTRLLMERFYKELRTESTSNGDAPNKAEALRTAQQYLMTLSADEIVDHCDQRLADSSLPPESERRIQLELDRAFAEGLISGVEPAAASCRSVLNRLEQSSDDRLQIFTVRAERQLSSLQEGTASPDSNRFSRIFHWAPFVLVGDWK